MRAVMYRLTLHEPLLATALQGDPNSSVSLNYVPGSLVRGALIQQYIRKHDLKNKLLENQQAQRLFIGGSTRYLHAYPLTEQGKLRSLPTPRSMLRRKHDELDENGSIELLDASHPDYGEAARAGFKQAGTLKSLRAPFCASLDKTLYTYKPDRTIAVHIQRDVAKGRSLRGSGEVFRYDALAPEQQFRGVVLVDSDNDAATIQSLLEELGTCWLGRSRSAQYGKTVINDVSIAERWRECATDESGASELAAGADNLHSITLLSDALLRDLHGQPIACLDSNTLAAYLELPEGALTIDDEHSFSATTEISGFNRYWKLPLPQEYALAAGSVISFRLAQPLSAEQATRLEQRGIGARRAEGFGRIAFNWREGLSRQARKGTIAKAAMTPPAPNMLANHSKALAQRMARRLYEHSIEQSIVDFVKNQPLTHKPENSQLGRLRVLVRQALPTGDVGYVRSQFAAFKSTARRQFERASLNNQPFDEWIENLLADPSQVWSQLSSFTSQLVAGQQAERNDRQVALQLLTAVLTAPAREEQPQEAQQ